MGSEGLHDIIERREKRKTISYIGVDIIVTPDNEVKVVELNGANAGGVGYKQLTGIDVHAVIFKQLELRYNLPVFHAGQLEDKIYPSFMKEMERVKLCSERKTRPVAPPHKRHFVLPLEPPEEENYEAIVWTHVGERELIDETSFLVVNPYAVERTLYHKQAANTLLNDLGQIRPQLFLAREENKKHDHREFVENSSAETFILKQDDGIQGKYIVAVTKEELLQNDAVSLYQKKSGLPFDEPTIILEELIPSKEIYSSTTGHHHFGCMRYYVTIESDQGDITVQHYGGYWRLAHKPAFSDELNGKLIANLHQKAYPQHVATEDLRRVRECVDQFMPTFYRRCLRLPLNERPDKGMRLADYCY